MKKKYYSIKVQFADPDGPEFPQINEVIQKAIRYYNQKSLIASNPKAIILHRILDPYTLELVLESEAVLPYPGKALQTFSRYLVDPDTEGTLNKYIYSKQLFKMVCEEISEQSAIKSDEVSNEEVATLRIRAISLILNASEVNLVKIIKKLEEEEK